ncbi:DUF6671 family protein [Glaciecola petra]|uniref:DUF6671 domain-containing protein n=1 Tax=Glaciecola petra TaxID=3075602 RepID=A0ABU2ZPJ1_9ALTE|nr:DUF6671 family protein [Aestuariibacter sp. P117]MDT0593377.1 hypothetical protein [Aestuariibacter sp. P117]
MSKVDTGTTISFLTKHGKERLIESKLSAALSLELLHTDAFDTDTLGTFDLTVPRKLSPVEAALKKAYLACDLTDCDKGLGSEGSFSSFMGLGLQNTEIIAYVDTSKNIEVIASAQQNLPNFVIEADNEIDATEKLKAYQPEQKWMFKSANGWHKGLDAKAIVTEIQSWPASIEPDFRAMHSPYRQKTILAATDNLISRLSAICPQCKRIDFVPMPSNEGLPCELCGQATNKPKPPILKCKGCGFIADSNNDNKPKEQIPAFASAFYCNFCNP